MEFRCSVYLLLTVLTFLKHRDDTSGEDAEDKEPTVAFKGRRTANSQGRRKGRITRSMTSEVEETTTPPLNNELGQSQLHCTKLFARLPTVILTSEWI